MVKISKCLMMVTSIECIYASKAGVAQLTYALWTETDPRAWVREYTSR
jgi:hypothetical protein